MALRRAAISAGLLLVGFIIGRAWGWRPWGDEQVTAALVSPDGQKVALLVEIPRMIDRNFELRMVSVGEAWDSPLVIFESPDEGSPPGTERFLWSRDGKQLLLVGQHFNVRSGTPVVGDETLYLLHDTVSGSVRCNASQTKLEGFGLADLTKLDFGLDFAKALAEAGKADAGAGNE